MFIAALRDLLVADADVIAALASYNFGGASTGPAVFTIDPAPTDCGQPLVVLTALEPAEFGTRDTRGGYLFADAMVWGAKARSEVALMSAARGVWNALDRSSPTRSGWNYSTVYADPPARVVDVDGFPGYRIRCNTYALIAS